MNFLAHLCLADGSPESITGNFLGDFVKGAPEGRFPAPVVRGIRLHRALDTYTDRHPAVLDAVAALPRARRRFAGIAIDMAFDHVLARRWQEVDAAGFAAFRRHVYAVLEARADTMPHKAHAMLASFTRNDWLGSYVEFEGIARALARMGQRISRPNPLAETGNDLRQAYAQMEHAFDLFWPDVRGFTAGESRRLARRLHG